MPVAGDASHPVAGHWPGIRRPVVPMQAPTAAPDSNPFPYMIPSNQAPYSGPDTVNNRDMMFNKRAILEHGGDPKDYSPENAGFLQLAAAAGGVVTPSAYRGRPSAAAWQKEHGAHGAKQAKAQAPAQAPSFLQLSASHPSTRHFMPPCYHVCPAQDAPNTDDEPNGGACTLPSTLLIAPH